MSATTPYATPLKSALAGMLVPIIAFGFEVGTGGATTLDYVKDRGSKGYPFADYDSSKIVADALVIRTSAENLAHIRAVLAPTVTALADILRVSRQAVYDWKNGKPVALENAYRLEDLARAADVFAADGLIGTSHLRRAIKNGKNFFELVRDGDSADSAARTLIEVVHSESRQRQALKDQLAGRRRPAREAFEEVGSPMLDERG